MITDLRNLKWANKKHEQIICEIKSDLYPDEGWIQFVAGKSSIENEALIYNLFIAGKLSLSCEDSDEEMILRGEMPVPEGYILENEALRTMTPEERVITGLDAPPMGYKVLKNQIVEMTPAELIRAGLHELLPGYKIEGDLIVEMSPVERINAGIDELIPGFKIKDNQIVEMSIDEKLKSGAVSQADYDKQRTSENIAELNRRLAEMQTPIVIAKAKRDPDFAAEIDAKEIALLAVMDQKGWPLTVIWPD